MRSLHRFFAPVLLAVTLAAAPACTVRTGKPVYVVDNPPPEPRAEQPRERVGMIWVHGRWEHVGNKWVWKEGRLIREKPGHRWRQGRWVKHGNRWQWHPGRWESRAVVRDHRTY